ncbi:transcription factor 7-like 2 isoform X3 [Dreissena polymorpha]|uniref:transcription factor 7-like 2 isoform X3 n=1 Tax=Dreissena polymorpha TaxID=45954 RepID=UPI002263EE00|nr:transcription factor 7-like 2 isoform X3 [Dreissena polymorpha]
MTMPHVNSGGSDDIYDSDEVKVYRHEGDEENEKKSSENLSEDKLGLVTETEENKVGYAGNSKEHRLVEHEGKPPPEVRDGPFSYIPNYPGFPNGATPTTMPPSGFHPYFYYLQGGKMPMLQSPLSVMMYNNEVPFSSPPPAHMGIPPVTIDPKTGLPLRHPFPYPTAPGQFPPSLYHDIQWQRPPGYPISGALGGPYPPSFTARYPPGLFPPGVPPGMPHPMAGPNKDSDNHRHGYDGSGNQSPQPEKKKPHIKKPLNAFMLFMKEQRAKVVAECTLKESAAINQILGRRWHSLDKAEQARYYEQARKEKELHVQLHPGWSARDNYGTHVKKKKRKADEALKVETPGECTSNAKKCRARYGMEQQKNWCKPCRRKKKCIRVYGDDCTDEEDDEMSDSQMGGDSYHDSDSMLGSPALSSASEDPFSTPSKSRSLKRAGVESPLVHNSTCDLPTHDLDHAFKAASQGAMPASHSPFSVFNLYDRDRHLPDRYISQQFPHMSMNASSSPKPFGLSRSYSIESLAKSSVNSDYKEKEHADQNTSMEYAELSPLSSPGILGSPKFSLTTFGEDINKNLSPKKALNNSFSISTLSVSSVTPSRVHCS